MRNDWPTISAGAPMPTSVSRRSASSTMALSAMIWVRISSTDASLRMSSRISANWASALTVSDGSTTRSGISTSSKWSR